MQHLCVLCPVIARRFPRDCDVEPPSFLLLFGALRKGKKECLKAVTPSLLSDCVTGRCQFLAEV
jgi:hypothetical protein